MVRVASYLKPKVDERIVGAGGKLTRGQYENEHDEEKQACSQGDALRQGWGFDTRPTLHQPRAKRHGEDCPRNQCNNYVWGQKLSCCIVAPRACAEPHKRLVKAAALGKGF